MLTGVATATPDLHQGGLRSLRWLMTLQTTSSGCFRPVGTRKFRRKAQAPRAFDQQPLEATATISACLQRGGRIAIRHGKLTRRESSRGFSAATICRSPLVDLETGSCRDGLHPDRRNENRGGESVVSYLLGLQRFARSRRVMSAKAVRNSQRAALKRKCQHPIERGETALSQVTFLNRQALHLRPDPARVVVRPFKPATEPRDLNPTDKTRANHIVDRVLALDPKDSRPVNWPMFLKTFQGRHRNLLEHSRRALMTWKTPSRPMRSLPGPAPARRRLFSARIFF